MFVKPDFKCCIATEIVTTLIGGALSAGTALAGTHMRNEAQKRESELAYRRQQAEIREQKQYNSPSAQMARMQAAGLNPNLMYERGEQGLQESIPEYQPAELENGVAPLGSFGSEMVQSLIGLKDLQNKTAATKSQIALQSIQGLREMAETEKTNEEVSLLFQEWGFNEQQNPLLLQKLNGEIRKIDADVDFIHKQMNLTDAQINELASRTSLQEAEVMQILTLLKPQFNKLVAETRALVSQDKLNLANCQVAFQNSEYLRNLTWEVTQRYYLDKWNIEQNLNIAEKEYVLKADSLSEQIREFNKENTREWVKYGTDTAFKVADLVAELLPMLLKGGKIGF